MFENREEAGRLLADKLKQFKGKENVMVLGIPRGGVVLAKIISEKLRIPLDIVVVKKIGAPFNPELAIGAVGPEISLRPTVFWDKSLIKSINIDKEKLNQELGIKNQERKEREKLLRGKKRPFSLKNKTVILVDDGVATGATAKVASLYVKKARAKEIILATPVISKQILTSLRSYFDTIVYIQSPSDFHAVGQFYTEFPQVGDDEVIQILRD